MIFVKPAMLLGLAAIAIPAVIHLLNRRKAQSVSWGAMLFLMGSLARLNRRVLLEEMLLLALRCLLVALVVLAMARPLVSSGSAVPWAVVLPAVLLAAAAVGAGTVFQQRPRRRWLAYGIAGGLIALAALSSAAEQWLHLRPHGAGGGKDIAIVIDGSASMTIRVDGTPNFDRAVAEARRVVESLRPGDTASIILAGASVEVRTPTHLAEQKKLQSVLDGLRPGLGTMAAADALNVAAIELAKGQNAAKQVVMLTDGQAAGWDTDAPARWTTVSDALWKAVPGDRDEKDRSRPPVPVICRMFPTRNSFHNLAVADVRLTRDVIGRDRPVGIDVRIENTGAVESSPAEVECLVDGQDRPYRSQVGRLRPGAAETVRFNHRFEPGQKNSPLHAVTARLPASDDLDADNSDVRVVRVIDTLPVLIVDGDPRLRPLEGASAFIAAALAPSNEKTGPQEPAPAPAVEPPARSFIEPVVVTTREFAALIELDRYAVVVLANVPRLPADAARRLEKFVAAGGGLLIALGDRSQPEFYNEWKTDRGQPLAGAALGQRLLFAGAVKPAHFDPATFNHPALALLADESQSDLARGTVTACWGLAFDNTDPAAQVGALLNTGDPLLVERQLGRGTVLTTAVSLDPSGGTLPTLRSFVPMVHEIVYYLVGPRKSVELNFRPRGRLTVPLRSGEPVGPGLAAGLQGDYYAGRNFDRFVLTRRDATVNLNWGGGSPDRTLPPDNFSVRWTGSILPRYSEAYTFRLRADDGARLWIDGKEIATAARNEAAGQVRLDADRPHDVRIEFVEGTAAASVSLAWESPSQPAEIVPADRLSPARPLEVEIAQAGSGVITAPDGSRQPVELHIRDGVLTALATVPAAPGLYRLSLPPSLAGRYECLLDPHGTVPVAVMGGSDEGRLDVLSPAQVDAVSRHIELLRPESADQLIEVMAGGVAGSELWKYLAVAALLAMLIEVGLARLIAARRKMADAAPVNASAPVSPSSVVRRLLLPLKCLIRTAVWSAAAWIGLDALSRVLGFGTSWPMWASAVLAGFSAEAVIRLYGLERRVVPRPAGVAIAGLRLLLVLLAVLMLIQPVFSREWTRRTDRYVAVLVDDSLSMQLLDEEMLPGEKLALARLFDPAAAARTPSPFAAAEDQMPELAATLDARARWLEQLRDTDYQTVQRQLGAHRDVLKTLFDSAAQLAARNAAIADRLAKANPPPPPATAGALKAFKELLAAQVQTPATAAAKLIETSDNGLLGRALPRLIESGRAAEKGLRAAAGLLPPLDRRLEESAFAALPAEQRDRINEFARKTRRAIGRAAVLNSVGGGPVVLDELQRKYIVRLHTFASDAHQVEPAAWKEETASEPTPAALETQPAEKRSTDFAAALRKSQEDVPAGFLSGVLIVSDGRHNGRETLEPIARELGRQGVPVCSVLVGSTRPPCDAALVGVDAPETVCLEDRLVVRARMRFNHLDKKATKVRLKLNGETVDEKDVAVTGERYGTVVELAHTPAATGVLTYEVELQPIEGELLTENNSRQVVAAVIEGRHKLLLVDGRPRWEYRYLRNLFAERDKSVQLQTVLLHPDGIAGAPPRELVHASASRPVGDVEASALPSDRAEWAKFDIVILGDIARSDLSNEAAAAVQEFVAARGGTLILVAGRWHLPSEYRDSPLRHLFPASFGDLQPRIERTWIRLTADGAEHVVMRQDPADDENRRIWESFPEIHWRYPALETKPGATVLAYAMPEKPPEQLAAPSDPAHAEDHARRQREFERENALFITQKFGAGRVLMLNFDQTWRLRYGEGDTYHHRFWGQVMRWANADNLPVGTQHVRMGTDHVLYAPGQPVIVRAKITNHDGAAVRSQQAAVEVLDGEATVLRKKLEYEADSVGMYRADLGALEPGKGYTVVLDCPEAAPLLAQEGVSGKLSTQIVVAAGTTTELTELSADGTVPEQLAAATGGVTVGPAEAARILESLGPEIERTVEKHLFVIWNSWPFLCAMMAVASAEWLVRKRAGLI